MQIVIDILEKDYNAVKEFVTGDQGRVDYTAVFKAIESGTPLPKGHGRLIDADEIQFENTEFDTYGDYCIAFDAIDQADTIIEADKESEVQE